MDLPRDSADLPSIVIVAEHASARFGGEAILPLHYFTRLAARGVDVWLVVHERTRSELVAAHPELAHRMRFVPDLTIHKALHRWSAYLPARVAESTLGLLSHLVTQVLERRLVADLVRERRIDVVHEPIPVSPKAPSLMTGVGAPVVVGPMNGGMDFPPGFSERQSALERRFVRFGRRLAAAANVVMPGKRHAALLLVANQRSRDALPSTLGAPVLEFVENGVDLSLFSAPAEPSASSESLRCVFVGRLIDLKGVDLLIDAVARVAEPVELHVVGDGPARADLEARARSFAAGRVTFHGAVPQARCAEILRAMDVLALPSLRECGGAVVLEAMAMGLPVVATRWGGPLDYVDEETGILVDPASPEAFVDGLGRALTRLAASPELRRSLGSAGRRKVEAVFDWERKIDRMLDVYRLARDGAAPTGGHDERAR